MGADRPDAPRTPDAHIPGKTHPLMMMTSDIALKTDPVYREICQKFLDDFDYFTLQFSKAWYKLTHRDMGPKERYAGPEKKLEDDLIWQDPIPSLDHPVIDGPTSPPSRRRSSGSATPSRTSPSRPFPRPRPSARPTSGAGPTVPASRWRRRRIGRSTGAPCR